MQTILSAFRTVSAVCIRTDRMLVHRGLPGLLAVTLGLIGLAVLAVAFFAPLFFGASGFRFLAGAFVFALTMLLIATFSDIFRIAR